MLTRAERELVADADRYLTARDWLGPDHPITTRYARRLLAAGEALMFARLEEDTDDA